MAGPLGTGFRFGDNGDGLCTTFGSDNFLGGAAAKSRVNDLREGVALTDGEIKVDAVAVEEAAEVDSRLSSPSAVVRGAEPCRRRGSAESSVVAAAEEDRGA